MDQYADTSEGIREAYEDVPRKVVDSSKSDLDTFAEVCDFVEEVAKAKAERLGPEGMRELLEMVGGRGGGPAALMQQNVACVQHVISTITRQCGMLRSCAVAKKMVDRSTFSGNTGAR